jgi:hypothetical protein
MYHYELIFACAMELRGHELDVEVVVSGVVPIHVADALIFSKETRK